MRQQRKLNEEVNDDLAVKSEEGFICCSRIKLDHGECRKKFKLVDYDKCTEELGDSCPVRKRLQLGSSSIPADHLCNTLHMIHKASVFSIVRDHDSKFI